MALEYLIVDHLNTKQLTRVFSKVLIDPLVSWNGTPCWSAHKTTDAGYGTIGCGSAGKTVKLHRYIFAWLIHPLPLGRENGTVDHLCRNRACCNPIHLGFVPHKINVLRGESFAAINHKKTHCARGHLLSGGNVYRSPSNPNSRACRTCISFLSLRYYHARTTSDPEYRERLREGQRIRRSKQA